MTRTAWLIACVAICGCDDAPPPCEGPSCGAGVGGSAPGLNCPASGVLHGPWSLHIDETSALVRWDACAPSTTELSFEPEDGGAARTVSGEQSASDVRTSYNVIQGVPPDLPGIYYRTEVALSGLEPGRCYLYQLAADPLRSGRVCTARPSGDSFKFLAMGDTNPAIGDTLGVMAQVIPENPDFYLHLGDIQYYASLFDSWAAWFPKLQPLLAQGAFLPCVGNHETENDYEFQDYYERLFGGAGFDGPVEYYRFQSGGVWFFSLSTELDLDPGTPQADWLEEQVADAARQPGYRAGIVFFHKPWITLADYSQDTSARNHFKPIFEANGVVLVLQGHVHGYERFDDGAITYVTSGGGGAALHDLDVNIEDRPDEAALRVTRAKRYHGTIFEVLSDRIEGRAIANDGELLDSFEVAIP